MDIYTQQKRRMMVTMQESREYTRVLAAESARRPMMQFYGTVMDRCGSR